MSGERNEQMFSTDPDDPSVSLEALGDAAAEQLGKLIERGDIRAIKLYYDLLERERKHFPSGRGDAEGTGMKGETGETALEEMADIRRAVFGDAVLSEDRRRADAVGVLPGGTGMGAGCEADGCGEAGADGDAGADDSGRERERERERESGDGDEDEDGM